MASTAGLGSAAIPGSSDVGLTRQDASQLVRQVNRLLNRQLSSICQINGLKSTGIKAELQKRIATSEFLLWLMPSDISRLLHVEYATSITLTEVFRCFSFSLLSVTTRHNSALNHSTNLTSHSDRRGLSGRRQLALSTDPSEHT